MSKELSVKLTRTVAASAKSCFEAWLHPETLKAFMGNCSGIAVSEARVDARVGGDFYILMKAGDTDIPHTGHYKIIEPYQRIAFTWLSVHQTLKDSLVTLEFKAIDEKTTQLTLNHTGFESETARKNHEGGWGQIIGGFVAFFDKQ